MYSGQFDHVQLPIAVFGWLTDAAFSFCFWAWPWVPFTPPHAASIVAAPVPAAPMTPSRVRNWRRDCSWPAIIRSTIASIDPSSIHFPHSPNSCFAAGSYGPRLKGTYAAQAASDPHGVQVRPG